MNESLTWLEIKDSEYLIIHRYELNKEINNLNVKAERKARKINKINKILEGRGE